MHLPIRQARLLLRRYRLPLGVLGAVLLGFALCLPGPLFDDPVSTVLLDREGRFLGGRIATDEQWRFPEMDTVPEKFARCITTFEDKRFYRHAGVDLLALGRAMAQNVRTGRVVSGGSTLSMQVIRLARKGRPRTLLEKAIEMVLATRLEWRYSKDEILALYASHAPFGGNVVGLETAAWKYYARPLSQLSWAEMATLAVLPNAPSLMHPGKNRRDLRDKRDRLLGRLCAAGHLDSLTLHLALEEPLPDAPLPLPSLAPHLLERVHLERRPGADSRIRSTLQRDLQVRSDDVVRRHHERLRERGIHNAAVLVLDVRRGDVLAYVGNTPCYSDEDGCAVDIIPSPRSTGSILKPLLYAAMLHDGELLPDMLVADVPTFFGSYNPSNYDRSYNGAVPASRALARSLNIPAVRMLHRYGVGRFQQVLQQLGMRTLDRPSSDYGLTLVLGGAEASLWDLAGIYASMARTLRYYRDYDGRYDPAAFRPPNYYAARSQTPPERPASYWLVQDAPLGAAAIWHTFEAMVVVARPEEDQYWEYYASSRRIAWKTGTSFGFRDAWAIGVTPEYVVAVWIGNADGEGRQGLLGVEAAAPVMFDVFGLLPQGSGWFAPPYDDMIEIAVCRQSGHRVGTLCPEQDTVQVPLAGRALPPCPYHRRVFLDPSGQYQVTGDCESPQAMVQATYFVLPPAQELYYRRRHPAYIPLPPYRPDCASTLAQSDRAMDLIYPQRDSRILVPVRLDGSRSRTVFEAVHRDPQATIYWHLDSTFVGESRFIHEMALDPPPGKHVLTLVDGLGERLERRFEVLEAER
ncbi:MAG: penicillin-binding protein 1C [Bacteroidia bacterium]